MTTELFEENEVASRNPSDEFNFFSHEFQIYTEEGEIHICQPMAQSDLSHIIRLTPHQAELFCDAVLAAAKSLRQG